MNIVMMYFKLNSLFFNFVKWQIYTVITIKVHELFGVKALGYLMVSYSLAPIIAGVQIGKIINLIKIEKLLLWSSVISLSLLLAMYFYSTQAAIIYVLSLLESISSLLYYFASRAYIKNCSLNRKILVNNHSFLVISELISNTIGVFVGSLIYYKHEHFNCIISGVLATIAILSIIMMPSTSFLAGEQKTDRDQNSSRKEIFINGLCYVYGLAFLFGSAFSRFLINFTSHNFLDNHYIYSELSFCLGVGSIIGILITLVLKDIKITHILYTLIFLHIFLALNLFIITILKNEVLLSALSLFCGASLSASRRMHNFFIVLYTNKTEQIHYLAKSNIYYNIAAVTGSFMGAYYIDLFGFKNMIVLSGIVMLILAIIIWFLIKKYYDEVCCD